VCSGCLSVIYGNVQIISFGSEKADWFVLSAVKGEDIFKGEALKLYSVFDILFPTNKTYSVQSTYKTITLK
jgi:hypothetical protein